MNSKFYLFSFILFAFYFFPIPSNSQCNVGISGDTCAGKMVIAENLGPDLKSLTWMINGTTAYTAYRSGYNPLPAIMGIVDYASCVFVDEQGRVFSADSPPVTGTTNIQQLIPGTTEPITLFTLPYDVLDIFVLHDTMYTAGVNPVIVQKISLHDGSITTLAGVGTNIKLNLVYAVAADSKSNILIAEQKDDGGRILRLNQKTGKVTIVAGNNGNGASDNQIAFAKDICIDSAQNIYVLDHGNARIQKWEKGAKCGITLAGGNGKGFNENQFSDAWSFVIDSEHNFYIADQEATRILKWKEGDTSGKVIAGGYGLLSKEISLLYPRGVALDQSGNVYVADGTSNHILKFEPSDSIFPAYYPPFVGEVSVTASYENGCAVQSEVVRINDIPVAPATIYGPGSVVENQQNIVFTVDSIAGQSYYWEVPAGCTIVSGQHTAKLVVNWGKKSGKINVYSGNDCGMSYYPYFKRITVSAYKGIAGTNSTAATAGEQMMTRIFPNPATDLIQIELNTVSTTTITLSIMNAEGRNMQTLHKIMTQGLNRFSISVNKFKPGIYYLLLQTGMGEPKRLSFLKQ